MNILLVGGAGYIGSHMVKRLLQGGARVTTLDNLSAGHRDAVLGGEFVQGDLADRALLDQLLRGQTFDAVMHFASWIQVGESVKDPAKYYQNNVANTLNLLDAMREAGVNRFVFSSTAATFGQPVYTPIDEAHPQAPINPYGHTKRMVEQVLADYGQAYGLRSVALRYFNAAGADPQGQLGERHEPETHLIPLVLQALFYPSVQLGMKTPSLLRYSANTLLSWDLMHWFEKNAQGGALRERWHREPLHAPSHEGVAPAWIGLAECDPLTDEGHLYAERLRAAGVPVQLQQWPGVIHDFINLGRFIPEAAHAHRQLAEALRRAYQG